MKVVALLSWYDESAAWLAALVTSLGGFADHLIAVDGAYALYPQGRRCSGPEQAIALQEACYANGMGLTIHTPTTPWTGNEVEKRSYMFDLALTVATPGEDWLLIIDGDTILAGAAPGTRDKLANTELDAAEVTMWTRNDPQVQAIADASREFILPRDARQPFRSLFRALPEMAVRGLHYVYTGVKDGRLLFLWHTPDGTNHPVVPALDLSSDVILEHRNKFRDMARAEAARGFYKRRGELNLEQWTTQEEDRIHAPNG